MLEDELCRLNRPVIHLLNGYNSCLFRGSEGHTMINETEGLALMVYQHDIFQLHVGVNDIDAFQGIKGCQQLQGQGKECKITDTTDQGLSKSLVSCPRILPVLVNRMIKATKSSPIVLMAVSYRETVASCVRPSTADKGDCLAFQKLCPLCLNTSKNCNNWVKNSHDFELVDLSEYGEKLHTRWFWPPYHPLIPDNGHVIRYYPLF